MDLGAIWLVPLWGLMTHCVRLRSHKHEYESGTVRIPCIRVLANTSLRVFQWRSFTHTWVWITCKFHSYE